MIHHLGSGRHSVGEKLYFTFLVSSGFMLINSLVLLLQVALISSNLALLLVKLGMQNSLNSRLSGLYRYHIPMGIALVVLSTLPNIIYRVLI